MHGVYCRFASSLLGPAGRQNDDMAVALFYETRAWAHVLKGLVELCVHDMTIEA